MARQQQQHAARLERLRQVREAEKAAAKATRQRYKEAVQSSENALWEAARNSREAAAKLSLSQRNDAVSEVQRQVGNAHCAARRTIEMQVAHAADDADAWAEARDRQHIRAAIAMREIADEEEEGRASALCRDQRREMIAATEAQRTAIAVEQQRQVDREHRASACQRAAAAVSMATAAQPIARRCRGPVDFASTRLHEGGSLSCSRSCSENVCASVQRHVA
eukprot:3468531-Pleurochrysis_carterae.AAC.1